MNVLDVLALLAAWGPCPILDDVLLVDSCQTAPFVDAGVYAFDTTAASTDGPPLPAPCDEGFGFSFESDIWFAYMPPASGVVTISTCGSADYDTRLAAYTGPCTNFTLVACNDDGTGCGTTSQMDVPVQAGTPIFIRLGGYGGATGAGTVSITLAP